MVKNPILAQAFSTISQVILGGCVRLFVAVTSIYMHLECVFFFFVFLDGVGSFFTNLT